MNTTVAPLYKASVLTAEQVSKAIDLNRNTMLGYVKRYNEGRHHDRLASIGIAPVQKGTTRLLSMEQVGILAVLRMAALASAPDAMLDILDNIAEHAAKLYDNLSAGLAWQGKDADRRPCFPFVDSPATLEGVQVVDGEWTFSIVDEPYRYNGGSLLTLAGYPVPTLLLALDLTLRTAWNRALWVAHGIEWKD